MVWWYQKLKKKNRAVSQPAPVTNGQKTAKKYILECDVAQVDDSL
jgi:hypothetical protein